MQEASILSHPNHRHVVRPCNGSAAAQTCRSRCRTCGRIWDSSERAALSLGTISSGSCWLWELPIELLELIFEFVVLRCGCGSRRLPTPRNAQRHKLVIMAACGRLRYAKILHHLSSGWRCDRLKDTAHRISCACVTYLRNAAMMHRNENVPSWAIKLWFSDDVAIHTTFCTDGIIRDSIVSHIENEIRSAILDHPSPRRVTCLSIHQCVMVARSRESPYDVSETYTIQVGDKTRHIWHIDCVADAMLLP